MLDRIDIGQVGLVVKNLNKAMAGYSQAAGLGPWNVYINSAPPLKCIYHGRPAAYKARVAMACSGNLTVELIEYLEGDSIHRDFLASGREGIEHFGIFVPDLDAALNGYMRMGVGILQQVDGLGIDGDGRYAYLDTESILGTILELIQNPSRPRPPDQVYP